MQQNRREITGWKRRLLKSLQGLYIQPYQQMLNAHTKNCSRE